MSDITLTTVNTLRSAGFTCNGQIYASVEVQENSLNRGRVLILSDTPATQAVIDFLSSEKGRKALSRSLIEPQTLTEFKSLAWNCSVIKRHIPRGTALEEKLNEIERAFHNFEAKVFETTRRFLAPYISKTVSFDAFQEENPVSFLDSLDR